MSELKPSVGDLVTVSIWENQENIPITSFYVIGRQPARSEVINPNTWEVRQAFEQQVQGMPTRLRELFTLQMELMADAFSRVVLPENNLDYLFSALFSGKVLEEGRPSDAIIYPSVQQDSALNNIAIKANVFDRVYRLKEAKEMFVTGVPQALNNEFIELHQAELNTYKFHMLLVAHYGKKITLPEFLTLNHGRYEEVPDESTADLAVYKVGKFHYVFGLDGTLYESVLQ